MIKNVLTHIANIEVYPIISLTLFVLVFAGAAIWAVTMQKNEAVRMGRLPLEDDSQEEGLARHE